MDKGTLLHLLARQTHVPSGLLLVPFDHVSENVAMNLSPTHPSDSASGTSRLIQACAIHRKGNENAEKLICQKKKKKKGASAWGGGLGKLMLCVPELKHEL